MSEPLLLSESPEVRAKLAEMLRETLSAIYRSYSDDSAFSGINPYDLRKQVADLGFLPEQGK